MPFAVFAVACFVTVWLVRMWKSRAVAQPVARPNLKADELDELRKKARRRRNSKAQVYWILYRFEVPR